MVLDGTVAAEKNRQDSHDDETPIRDRHSFASQVFFRTRHIFDVRYIFTRLSYDHLQHTCHLE